MALLTADRWKAYPRGVQIPERPLSRIVSRLVPGSFDYVVLWVVYCGVRVGILGIASDVACAAGRQSMNCVGPFTRDNDV